MVGASGSQAWRSRMLPGRPGPRTRWTRTGNACSGRPCCSPRSAPAPAGQVAAGALGQELSNVALEILRRGMDTPPTITIRPGQPFNVFLNGDLVFDKP